MVIREQGTGKLTLVGCFNMFNAPKFPFVTPLFFVTPFITNLRPPLKSLDVTVRIVAPVSAYVLSNTSGHAEIRQDAPPIKQEIVLEFPLPLMPFTIQSPGTYTVEVLVNSDPVGTRTLLVVPITAAPQPQLPENPPK